MKLPGELSLAVKDLVCKRLLQRDLTQRYGNLKNGVNNIKNHIWYKSTDWVALHQKKVATFFDKYVTPAKSLKTHQTDFLSLSAVFWKKKKNFPSWL